MPKDFSVIPEIESLYKEATDNLPNNFDEYNPMGYTAEELKMPENPGDLLPPGVKDLAPSSAPTTSPIDTGILSALLKEYQAISPTQKPDLLNAILSGASGLADMPYNANPVARILSGLGSGAKGFLAGRNAMTPKGGAGLDELKTISEIYKNLREPKGSTPKAENPFNVVLGIASIDNPELRNGMIRYYASQYGMAPEEVARAVAYGKVQDPKVKAYVDDYILKGSGDPTLLAGLNANQKAQAVALLRLYTK